MDASTKNWMQLKHFHLLLGERGRTLYLDADADEGKQMNQSTGHTCDVLLTEQKDNHMCELTSKNDN